LKSLNNKISNQNNEHPAQGCGNYYQE